MREKTQVAADLERLLNQREVWGGGGGVGWGMRVRGI